MKTNDNILKIINHLGESDTLNRLLFNRGENPLSVPLPSNYNFYQDLLMTNFFPLNKEIDASEDVNTFLFCYFDKLPKTKTTGTEYKDIILRVDIVSHLDEWVTDNGLRPYLLYDEVDELLNEVPIEISPDNKLDAIRGYLTYMDGRMHVFNQKFSGFQMAYKFSTFSRGVDNG